MSNTFAHYTTSPFVLKKNRASYLNLFIVLIYFSFQMAHKCNHRLQFQGRGALLMFVVLCFVIFWNHFEFFGAVNVYHRRKIQVCFVSEK